MGRRSEKLRADEDGHHTGHELLEWLDMWSIHPEVVAGERSWAMGIIGRHQQMFREMLAKAQESTKMPVEKVLVWCFMCQD